MLMGCYGIGVSRVVAAVAEQYHDEHGLAGRSRRSVRRASRSCVPGRGEQANAVTGGGRPLYADLGPRVSTCSYDDRDVSPGVQVRRRRPCRYARALVVGAKGVAGSRRAQTPRGRVSATEPPLASVATLALSG